MQKRILVTGATGKVGQVFINRLLNDSRFDTFIVRALCHSRTLDAQPRLEVVRGSIQDLATVEQAMSDVTHMLHLATVKETPDAIMDVAIKGIFWLLEVARQSETFQQFILIGGDAGMGHFVYPHPIPVTETQKHSAYPGCYALSKVLERQAVAHRDTLCVGRTHGVHAEPTTFGLKLAVWVDEMRRNKKRLEDARDAVAVGAISGTVGTHASVPPKLEEIVCERLGMGLEAASTQVIQRDRHAQFVTTLAIIGASLEKFATEIRALQKTEVREAEEPFDEGQTGSSAMPHKRNPELCERICGMARVLRGYAVTSMENIALWHERDISHSSTERIVFPDACLLLDYMLDLFRGIMDRLTVSPEQMRKNLDRSYGLVFSQRVLLALIETGLSRQVAYVIVQKNAMQSWREEKPFLDLLLADPEVTNRVAEDELRGLFDYNYYLTNIGATFERLGL